jgi:uncharacterized RmlC-like cupin family protein
VSGAVFKPAIAAGAPIPSSQASECMTPEDSQQTNPPSCRTVRAAEPFEGKQALLYAPGISAESVGAQNVHLQILTIPAGARGKAHKHEGHETAIYVLSGKAGTWHGERLEEHFTAQAGDFVYIPAGVPHLPYNLSETEACVAVIARTDPNEQESVVLLPELDKLRP